MPLLTVLTGFPPDRVEIVRHLADGNVVVRFAAGQELTTPPEYLSAAPGEALMAPATPTGRMTEMQYRVLSTLARAGAKGLTDDEHEAINGLRADSAGVRRHELEIWGYVRHTGESRKTRRGSKAKVWEITYEGESFLRLHQMGETG